MGPKPLMENFIEKQRFLSNLNSLMKESILFGGDAGGPYGGDTNKVEFYLQAILANVGIKDYAIIWIDDLFPKVYLTEKV